MRYVTCLRSCQPLVTLIVTCYVLLIPFQSNAEPTRAPGNDPGVISFQADPTVDADLRELRILIRSQFAGFGEEEFGSQNIGLVFIGKGATADLTRLDAEEGRVDPPSTAPVTMCRFGATVQVSPSQVESELRRGATIGPCTSFRASKWRVFNPRSQNEFEITVPRLILETLHGDREQRGLTGSTKGRVGDSAGNSPEFPTAPSGAQTFSFSNGMDNRTLRTATTTFPWRTIADMGGCTATFVGPRHIVTAAHCLYSRTNNAWGFSFTVAPGRDRNNFPYPTTTLPPGPGETGWYFTPAEWRQANPPGGSSSPYDIGIVVTPDRLGDTVGWMGYVTRSGADLDAATNLNRGYPFCESETGTSPGNPERIDEPVPCQINGLYGDVNECDLSEFSSPDNGGWNRRVRHSCDAGAAMSGSSVYHYFFDPKLNATVPVVSMIHTTSLRCRFVGDAACTATDNRPLEATRLTVEYRNWISYFRSLFP